MGNKPSVTTRGVESSFRVTMLPVIVHFESSPYKGREARRISSLDGGEFMGSVKELTRTSNHGNRVNMETTWDDGTIDYTCSQFCDQ